MTQNELIEALKVAVGYNYDPTARTGKTMYHIGTALSDEEFFKFDERTYQKTYYPRVKALIEKLPWISVKDQVPSVDGDYLTLLDCNEHEIDVNHFREDFQHWVWADRHVCYWMPIPEPSDEEVWWTASKMNWRDGGRK